MVRLDPPVAFVALAARLDAGSLAALDDALSECLARSEVRAIVLTGAREGELCEGLEASALLTLTTRADAASLARRIEDVVDRIERSHKPVVAAIGGPAMGAGLGLALACHARVASDDHHTRLGLDEAALGLIPVAGALVRLARLCGARRALELFETGQRLSSAQALAAGLVDRVVPRGELLDAAARLALAARPARPEGEWGARALAAAVTLPASRSAADPDHPALDRAREVLGAYARRGPQAARERSERAFAELAVSTQARARVALARDEAAARSQLASLRASHGGPSQLAICGASACVARLAGAALEAGASVSWGDPAPALGHADLLVLAEGVATPRAAELASATRPGAVVALVGPRGSLASLPAVPGRAWVGVRAAGRLLELSARAPEDRRGLAFASLLVGAAPRVALVAPDDELGVVGRLRRAFRLEIERLRAEGARPEEISRAAIDWGFCAQEVGAHRGRLAHGGPVAPEELQLRLALAVVDAAFRAAEELTLEPREVDLAAVAGLGFPAFRGGPIAYAHSLGPDELRSRVEIYRRQLDGRLAPAPLLSRLIGREREGA